MLAVRREAQNQATRVLNRNGLFPLFFLADLSLLYIDRLSRLKPQSNLKPIFISLHLFFYLEIVAELHLTAGLN